MKKNEKEYRYITESLCCIHEVNTTLQINYISILKMAKKSPLTIVRQKQKEETVRLLTTL